MDSFKGEKLRWTSDFLRVGLLRQDIKGKTSSKGHQVSWINCPSFWIRLHFDKDPEKDVYLAPAVLPADGFWRTYPEGSQSLKGKSGWSDASAQMRWRQPMLSLSNVFKSSPSRTKSHTLMLSWILDGVTDFVAAKPPIWRCHLMTVWATVLPCLAAISLRSGCSRTSYPAVGAPDVMLPVFLQGLSDDPNALYAWNKIPCAWQKSLRSFLLKVMDDSHSANRAGWCLRSGMSKISLTCFMLKLDRPMDLARPSSTSFFHLLPGLNIMRLLVSAVEPLIIKRKQGI